MNFFDEGSGAWLPMPLAWERHTPSVAPLITEIQVRLKMWNYIFAY